MGDITLVLGPVVFNDFEIPARINIGGAQRVALHCLIGGTRVIDSLGRDDAEIRFEGVFTGVDATLRARTLDELRASGTPLPLTWDVFYYTVILTHFEAQYQSSWWIPFRIICTVLRDEAAALLSTVVSLADSLVSDLTAAASAATGGGVDLTAALSTVSAPDATSWGSSGYMAAQTSLGGAQATLSQSLGTAEAALAGSGFGSVSSPSAGVASLNAATSAAQQLGALTTARAYVGRASLNLANAGT